MLIMTKCKDEISFCNPYIWIYPYNYKVYSVFTLNWICSQWRWSRTLVWHKLCPTARAFGERLMHEHFLIAEYRRIQRIWGRYRDLYIVSFITQVCHLFIHFTQYFYESWFTTCQVQSYRPARGPSWTGRRPFFCPLEIHLCRPRPHSLHSRQFITFKNVKYHFHNKYVR